MVEISSIGSQISSTRSNLWQNQIKTNRIGRGTNRNRVWRIGCYYNGLGSSIALCWRWPSFQGCNIFCSFYFWAPVFFVPILFLHRTGKEGFANVKVGDVAAVVENVSLVSSVSRRWFRWKGFWASFFFQQNQLVQLDPNIFFCIVGSPTAHGPPCGLLWPAIINEEFVESVPVSGCLMMNRSGYRQFCDSPSTQ